MGEGRRRKEESGGEEKEVEEGEEEGEGERGKYFLIRLTGFLLFTALSSPLPSTLPSPFPILYRIYTLISTAMEVLLCSVCPCVTTRLSAGKSWGDEIIDEVMPDI